MKYRCNHIITFLLLLSCSMYSQQYVFDYYTVYEYRAKEQDSATAKIITFSNSKNPDFHLTVREEKNKITADLRDISTKTHFEFRPPSSLKNLDPNNFQVSTSRTIAYANSQRPNAYEIRYNSNSNYNLLIKKFKNDKLNKLLSECFIETAPSEITQLQRFNFPVLRDPLWSGKFELKNNEAIINCYFIENKKKVHFWKLIEMKNTDFTLNITTNSTLE